MSALGQGISGRISEWAGGLRFPYLFGLVAFLFLVDLLVPDLVPFLDEILLGLATILLANWRRRRGDGGGGHRASS